MTFISSQKTCLALLIAALVVATGAFEFADRLGTATPYRILARSIPTPASPPAGCKHVFTNTVARYESTQKTLFEP